jgi:hypothetical protein
MPTAVQVATDSKLVKLTIRHDKIPTIPSTKNVYEYGIHKSGYAKYRIPLAAHNSK